MIKKACYIFGLLGFVSALSLAQQPENRGFSDVKEMETDTIKKHPFMLVESKNEADEIITPQMEERLLRLRENYKTINSITQWTAIDKKQFIDEGIRKEVTIYYQNLQPTKVRSRDNKDIKLIYPKTFPLKIICRYKSEQVEYLAEYYLLDQELSFIIEKMYDEDFDQMIFYPNDDNQSEGIEVMDIPTMKYYFENGKLIHVNDNLSCNAPFSSFFVKMEQQRILTEFNQIVTLLK